MSTQRLSLGLKLEMFCSFLSFIIIFLIFKTLLNVRLKNQFWGFGLWVMIIIFWYKSWVSDWRSLCNQLISEQNLSNHLLGVRCTAPHNLCEPSDYLFIIIITDGFCLTLKAINWALSALPLNRKLCKTQFPMC